MGRTTNLKNDVKKAREIKIIKGMRGWEFIEEFLAIEEGKLNKGLLNGPKDKVDEYRGAIKFVRKFKVFLDMVNVSGLQAAHELEKILQKV